MSKGVSEYLQNIENIQENILIFIENEDNQEENYQNLIQLFNDQKILDSPSEIKLILTLISKISDNHYRLPNFFSKLEQIILFFKDAMEKNLSFVELKATEDGYHLYKSVGFTDEVSKYHVMKWYHQQ